MFIITMLLLYSLSYFKSFWESDEKLFNHSAILILFKFVMSLATFPYPGTYKERDGKGRELSEHLFIESTLLMLLHLIFEQACEARIIISSSYK